MVQVNLLPISWSVAFRTSDRVTSYEFVVGTHGPAGDAALPKFVDRLAREPSVRELKWLPEAMAESVSNPLSE
jgi:hypothetical protein